MVLFCHVVVSYGYTLVKISSSDFIPLKYYKVFKLENDAKQANKDESNNRILSYQYDNENT